MNTKAEGTKQEKEKEGAKKPKTVILVHGDKGGVGKTTLSAAVAVALAARGYRTVVLTVDPARRLANALGLENFSVNIVVTPLAPHRISGDHHTLND